MGILSLAAVLLEHKYTVEVIDLNSTYYSFLDSISSERDFCAFAAGRISATGSDVIGFGSICSSYPLTLRIAEAVRNVCASTPILFGGPQASVVDEATLLAFPCVDIVVRGEAEETLPLVLDRLSQAKHVHGIPGITFRQNKVVCRNPNAPPIHDLDALPLPAFHLFKDFAVHPSLSFEVGRGCPFTCSFCSTNDFFRRRFRLKSPETVVRQMSLLSDRYDVPAFDFVHDMFTVDRKRVVDICHALLDCGRQFYWGCSARTDCVDEELLDLMASAGCCGIFFGVETGSPRMQKLIEKDLDIPHAHRMVEASVYRQMRTTVSLIVGFPEEAPEDFAATANFIIKSARLDGVEPQIHLLAPLAATPLQTLYRDQLSLDNIFSDMSHQSWVQHPADRVLIGLHPDVFSNFYALPTRMDRTYLYEFTLFLHYGLEFFRWLMIALHHSSDIISTFDQWLAWKQQYLEQSSNQRRFYASQKFFRGFLDFVDQTFLTRSNEDSALQVLAKFEAARFIAMTSVTHWVEIADDAQLVLDYSTVLCRPKNVSVFSVQGDVPAIIAALRSGAPLSDVDLSFRTLSVKRTDWHVELAEESHLAASMLQLCDRPATVSDLMDEFTVQIPEFEGIPGQTVFAHTAKSLIERGLLCPA